MASQRDRGSALIFSRALLGEWKHVLQHFFLGHIVSKCVGLCTMKIVKIKTYRMCARREAKGFKNILSSSTNPLEVVLIDMAIPSIQPGSADVVDQVGKQSTN